MHIDEFALVRSLVPVAWADGTFEAQEKEMLRALMDAYGASPEQQRELEAYASERRTLDEIDLQALSAGDRRLLLQHAVVLTFADGKQATEEVAILAELATRLRIPQDEATSVIAEATARAKKNLGLL
jgi:tellurite resistance protein